MIVLMVDNKTKQAYFYNQKTKDIYFVEGEEYMKFLKKSNSASYSIIAVLIILFPLSKLMNINSSFWVVGSVLIIAALLGVMSGMLFTRITKQQAEKINLQLTNSKFSKNFRPIMFSGDVVKTVKQNITWNTIANVGITIIVLGELFLLFTLPFELRTVFFTCAIFFVLCIKFTYMYPREKIKFLKQIMKSMRRV